MWDGESLERSRLHRCMHRFKRMKTSMWCVFNWYIAVITHLVVVVVSTGKMKVHNNDIVYVKRMIVRYWALEKNLLRGNGFFQRIFFNEVYVRQNFTCMCVISKVVLIFSSQKTSFKGICVFITEIENHVWKVLLTNFDPE